MEETFESVNPVSQTIYQYLDLNDIANIQKTTKNLDSYLKSYIKFNNDNFIKIQVYNIYIKALYLSIYQTLKYYDNSTCSIMRDRDFLIDFRFLKDDRADVEVQINNSSNNNYVKTVSKYLDDLNINYNVDYDKDADNTFIIFDSPKGMDEFYYFMLKFPILPSRNNQRQTDEIHKYTFLYSFDQDTDDSDGDSELNDIYAKVKDLFNPNKDDLIKLLKTLQYKNTDESVFKDVKIRFVNFYENTDKDFLKFIYNNL